MSKAAKGKNATAVPKKVIETRMDNTGMNRDDDRKKLERC